MGTSLPGAGGAVLNALTPKGPEFSRLFTDFEHTAYRLEFRERYNSPIMREPIQRFLTDGHTDMDWLGVWMATIREQTEQGKVFQRVRVASLPLSDYNRFSVWTAKWNNEAGEEIRYLPREDASDLPGYDYWLFDSRKLVRMHFNEDDDTFVGFEVVDDSALIVELNYWRDAAWHRAITRDEFAAKHLNQP